MTDPDTSKGWVELTVLADHEAVEPVSELFATFGYNEGVVIEEPFIQEPDGDNLAVDFSRPVTVRTYAAAADVTDSEIERVRQGLWHLGRMREIGPLQVELRAEEDWANAWKDHYRPIRAGKRIVIRPPWFEYDPLVDDIVIELDPGMAFGTGTHPSTRLCLLGLETYVRSGDKVLDVGTGSGILAIAALRLGAASVDAVDNEPVAVRSALDNIERNQAIGINVELGSAGQDGPFPGEYDHVVANIISRILIELHLPLIHSVRNGGKLILSGIVEPREPLVREAFEAAGLVLLERQQIEDWVGLVYEKPI